jgi:ubiquinone/menaquinone biosynthesis C-methylase UbiE
VRLKRPVGTPTVRSSAVSNVDDVRARFGATAGRVAEHGAAQVELVRQQLREFVDPRGDERAIDVGTGAGTLALALAPLVREVVGVDVVPELLEAARRGAPENVSFVEADATALPFEAGSFDLACCRRTLHHVARPELVVAELARITRPGGAVFVDDQIAPVDPLAALELDRFERARDPSHTRTLPDVDLRGLFDANDLVLRQTRFQQHRRELDYYLDLAGCEGEARERAKVLSPGGPAAYVAESGWYLLNKRG